MKNFDPNKEGRKGILINKVRSAVRAIPKGTSTEEVIEEFGKPDDVINHEGSLMGEFAQKQIESGQLGEIARIIYHSNQYSSDLAWIYVNPYRDYLKHIIYFEKGKVVRVAELQHAL